MTGDRPRMAVPPQLVAKVLWTAPQSAGPRDRTHRGHLARENPWLQLQGTCVALNVRYAPIATTVRSAAK
jgi:hypothetical protein